MSSSISTISNENLQEIVDQAEKTEWLTLSKAADLAGVDGRTLKKWLKDNNVPHRFYPRKFRIRKLYVEILKKQIEAEGVA